MISILLLMLTLPRPQIQRTANDGKKQNDRGSNPSYAQKRPSLANIWVGSPDAHQEDQTDQKQTQGESASRAYSVKVTALPADRWYHFYIISTVAGVIVAVGGVMFLWYQLHIYKKADRAWVFVSMEPFGDKSVKNTLNGIYDALELVVYIYNYGKTPAFIKSIAAKRHTLSDESDIHNIKERDKRGEPLSVGRAVAPSGQYRHVFDVMQPEQLPGVITFEHILVIYGEVSYRDIYRETHSTKFCLRYGLGVPRATFWLYGTDEDNRQT